MMVLIMRAIWKGLLACLSLSCIAHAATPNSVTTYPTKTVRIVTALAGGGADLVARMIGQGISAPLGQAIVVENRPSGIVQGEIVARSAPDGYTLLLAASSHWIAPLFYSDATFDPVKDFTPVTLVGSSPNILVVHPSLAAGNVKELIALARESPGKLNYSSAQMGSPNHVAAELFKAMAGVNIVRVGYKGAGPALSAVMAGEVQLAFGNAASAFAMVKSGKLKALAVTSAQPSALAPGLPTVTASGVPGYESASMYALFAPARTPGAVIRRLNQEVVTYLKSAEARERFFNAGIDGVGSSPEQIGAIVKVDTERLGKLIKQLGIRGE